MKNVYITLIKYEFTSHNTFVLDLINSVFVFDFEFQKHSNDIGNIYDFF